MKYVHCYMCSKYKLETDFYIDKSRGAGFSSRCKKCTAKRAYQKRHSNSTENIKIIDVLNSLEKKG